MALSRWSIIGLALVVSLAGCSKSDDAAPAAGAAPAASTPGSGKAPDADTATDPSKGERGAGDMPAGTGAAGK